MTEPVARAASPRRTVRVAIALLAGQTALCAVIGWVTFGSPQTGPRPPHPVAPLAAPPLAMPTASLALPPAPAPPTRAPKSTAAVPARRAHSPRPHPSPAKERATATEEQPSTVIAPGGVPTAQPPAVPSPDVASTPAPSPAESGEVQGPVVEGEPCEPEGAPGRTEDDVPLSCVRQEDDRLVWQIN